MTARSLRWLLRQIVPRPALFTPLLRLGQYLRGVMPAEVRQHIPPRQQRLRVQSGRLPRRMVLLQGCVQRAATPRTNDAARLVFARLGIELVFAAGETCCGAVNHHLGAHDAALANMRRTVDVIWPHIENGAEAIISSATGCGVQIADYGRLLSDNPDYAEKAARISGMTLDIAEALNKEALESLPLRPAVVPIAVHIPCSQQHGMRQPDTVSRLMASCGYRLADTRDDHLCCGSAGTYSILQPATSRRLRMRKVTALEVAHPERIVTSNVGCQLHLAAAAGVPVVHWIECIAEDLQAQQSPPANEHLLATSSDINS